METSLEIQRVEGSAVEGAGFAETGLTAYRSGEIPEWKWTPYSELAMQMTVSIPLQDVTLAYLSEVAAGTILTSNWLVSDDVPLSIDDTFLANVCFEPAGMSLGVRISDFAPRGAAADLRGVAAVEAAGDPELRDVLRVTTTLCFGTAQLRLEEIMRLAIGDIVVLGRTVNGPVKVTVGEHVVASGELVVVGGCYAVQVAAMGQMSHALMLG